MKQSLVPAFDSQKIKTNRFRDYALRFAFGALIALVAGLIGTALGPKAGGVFLGFPAILPASLTLIQRKEGHERAAVDSVGAVLGAVAMIVFALLVAWNVARWGVVPSVVGALVVWLVVAAGLYFLVATVYGREPTAP